MRWSHLPEAAIVKFSTIQKIQKNPAFEKSSKHKNKYANAKDKGRA